MSEICTLPPVLLKSSAVPSYHPRTTCSSREERRRGTKNPVKGCGGGRGSSPTQAVTMATVPSCCLLSLSLTHSLKEARVPLGRQQDSDPLGSPRRVEWKRGGLGKRLSITPGDGVVFCSCLIPSPSFLFFFSSFSLIHFCYFFPAEMSCVLRESRIELSFVVEPRWPKENDQPRCRRLLPQLPRSFISFSFLRLIQNDVEILLRSRISFPPLSFQKLQPKIPSICVIAYLCSEGFVFIIIIICVFVVPDFEDLAFAERLFFFF